MSKGIANDIRGATCPKARVHNSPPLAGGAGGGGETAARNAKFPIARFAAGANLTPELVRQKLVAEYRLARAGPLPAEMA